MFIPRLLPSSPAREPDRAPLAATIFSDDPSTAQAALRACEALPSFDCRARIAATGRDAADLRERPGEVAIVDRPGAALRFDPSRFPTAPCVLVVHDCAPDPVPASLLDRGFVYLHIRDLTPTALQMAIRSALHAQSERLVSGGVGDALERQLRAAREDRQRLLDEVAPIARGLEGLLEILACEDAAQFAPGSRLGLVQDWTRDLGAVVDRHQAAIARAQGGRADLNAILERVAPLFEPECARRGQTMVLSSPAEPVMVLAEEQALRRAILLLLDSMFEREGRDRRIDIVLWRSLDECRLALVSGPAVRRHDEEETSPDDYAAVRAATGADARMMGALDRLKDIGGHVESSSSSAFGATLLVSLPTA